MDITRLRRVMWLAVVMVFIAFLMSMCDKAHSEEVDVNIVIQIESGGNPNAYNEKSGAIGLMQITPICLKEYNIYYFFNNGKYPDKTICSIQETRNKKRLTSVRSVELYVGGLNKEIGTWYLNTRIPQMLKAYKISDTIDNRLISYNAGIKVCKDYHRGKIKRLPRETVNYIKKYHNIEESK